MKKNKFNIIRAILVLSLFMGSKVHAESIFYAPETNSSFGFEVFNKGYNFSANDLNAVKRAGQYWSDILIKGPNFKLPIFSLISASEDGASATCDFVDITPSDAETYINALYNGRGMSSPPPEDTGTINVGFGCTDDSGWAYPQIATPMPFEVKSDLMVVVAHEMAHAFGIYANVDYDNEKFHSSIASYDSYLRVKNGANVTEVKPDMDIVCDDNTELGPNIFNITDDAPYFVGTETMKVLEEGLAIGDEVSMTHYQDGHYGNQEVAGLPILGKEGDGTPQDPFSPELSHIELRNSYMSHQEYRNWSVFMEAELALLKDIGYEIDLRKHYGISYYADSLSVDNTRGYGGVYNSSTDEYSGYSNAQYGIGLHIYGNENKVTQDSDILTNGVASLGVRIDGVGNDYIVDNNSKIHANGLNSIGLAVAFGKDHEISIKDGSEIIANGVNGIGARFDFAKNILGESVSHQGSYINSVEKTKESVFEDIKGALVNNFNIDGKLEGSNASIYISDSAYVKDINITNNAQIKGDIISDWNSKTSGEYKATVQSPGSQILKTNLNFGTKLVGTTIQDDTSYDGKFSNNILGKDTVIMNVKAGKLTYDNKLANVYDVNIDSGAKLTGSANYQLTNDFTNSGEYNPTNNASITAKNIINTGDINVSTPFYLNTNINEGVAGQGNLNIGDINNSGYLIATKNVTDINTVMNINNNSTINLANNNVNDLSIHQMNLNDNLNVLIDLDLKTLKSDNFGFSDKNDLTMNNNLLNIVGVNCINSKEILTNSSYKIPFIKSGLNNDHLEGNVVSNVNSGIYTPIFNYGLAQEDKSLLLYLPHGGGVSNHRNYNPAVLASPVTAQVGGYLTQLNSYDQAFANFDMMTALTAEQRISMKYANKMASLDQNGIFDPNQLPEESKGLWFKPYATFEKVGLSNGPNVENTAYGSFFGGDTGIVDLGKGWDGMYSAYVGYNGSHQSYDSVGVYQNGGNFGGSAFAFKNKFWAGLTANVGANVGQASTMFGNEDFTMLMSGIAAKTGYNLEFFNGKFILQPNFLMSYSFVNTFDYTNAAGVKIDSNPLNAIQITPGIKLIGNLKKGWQPYAAVQMIWNILDDTRFKANNVSLPNMSVDPYVQYGVGLQRRWGDRFTGFGQVMLRNGGRTGVMLNLGFRWALGK